MNQNISKNNDSDLASSNSENPLSAHALASRSGVEQPANTVGIGDDSIKQILVIVDDDDSAFAIKACLESYNRKNERAEEFQVIEVTSYMDPAMALLEFKPFFMICYSLISTCLQ